MRNFVCILFLLLSFYSTYSQTVILEREEDGEMDTAFNSIFQKEEVKWMFPVYFNYTIAATQSDAGAEIRNFLSCEFGLGFLPLYSLNEYFAAGFDLAYHYSTFELKQDADKLIPTPYAENERESFRFYTLQLGPALKITYQPSDDKLGKYIILQGDAVWLAGSHHFTKNENEDGSVTEVLTKKLQYTTPFYYTASARIGFGAVSVFGNYRFTDIFNTEYAYPELAKLRLGVSFVFN